MKIEEPLEIGTDYVVLPFHVYTTSTRSYVQQENPPEVPEELDKMRNAFRRVIGRSKDAKEIVIEGILARSLLKPNGKTYLAADGGPFIVVEPQLKPEDVRQWAALDKPSAIS